MKNESLMEKLRRIGPKKEEECRNLICEQKKEIHNQEALAAKFQI
jgi:hypothetical protein